MSTVNIGRLCCYDWEYCYWPWINDSLLHVLFLCLWMFNPFSPFNPSFPKSSQVASMIEGGYSIDVLCSTMALYTCFCLMSLRSHATLEEILISQYIYRNAFTTMRTIGTNRPYIKLFGEGEPLNSPHKNKKVCQHCSSIGSTFWNDMTFWFWKLNVPF